MLTALAKSPGSRSPHTNDKLAWERGYIYTVNFCEMLLGKKWVKEEGGREMEGRAEREEGEREERGREEERGRRERGREKRKGE